MTSFCKLVARHVCSRSLAPLLASRVARVPLLQHAVLRRGLVTKQSLPRVELPPCEDGRPCFYINQDSDVDKLLVCACLHTVLLPISLSAHFLQKAALEQDEVIGVDTEFVSFPMYRPKVSCISLHLCPCLCSCLYLSVLLSVFLPLCFCFCLCTCLSFAYLCANMVSVFSLS